MSDPVFSVYEEAKRLPLWITFRDCHFCGRVRGRNFCVYVKNKRKKKVKAGNSGGLSMMDTESSISASLDPLIHPYPLHFWICLFFFFWFPWYEIELSQGLSLGYKFDPSFIFLQSRGGHHGPCGLPLSG